MWIERPGKIFFTAVEGDHVHLGLPVDFPVDNEIQFDIAFNAIQWYIFLKKALQLKIFSQCPAAFVASWKDKECWHHEKNKELNLEGFGLRKNQIQILTPTLLCHTPHCRTISAERNLKKNHFRRVPKHRFLSSIFFSPCLLCRLVLVCTAHFAEISLLYSKPLICFSSGTTNVDFTISEHL